MSEKTRKQQLEEMLADDPADVELRYMLAMEYASEENDEAAVNCFEEIIRHNSNYIPAYHQAGRALVRLGQIEAAKAMLQRGIPAAQQHGNDHAAREMMELLESL